MPEFPERIRLDIGELRLVITSEEIAGRVEELGEMISAGHRSRGLTVIGVLKGGVNFMADLIRNITVPMNIDFVRLTRYGDKTESSMEVRITKDIEIDIRGRDVIIVDDIYDTGMTLRFLVDRLSAMGAKSVKVCVLINKKERRTESIEADYSGFEMGEGFVVGYGLDYKEGYRNLPGIYMLHED
ncbi:hypoxanthine phosphoribosyltransferase [Thermodesulfobacteriota bacterium]